MVFSTQIISALLTISYVRSPNMKPPYTMYSQGFNTSLILELELPSYPVHLSISS